MYTMKSIIPIDNSIDLPTCMYYMKNHNQEVSCDNLNLNIRDQVMRYLKNTPNKSMLELEVRQDQLLKKLDKLYEKITIISSCKELDHAPTNQHCSTKNNMVAPEELVLVLGPDNLPWFLIQFIKANTNITFSWHIHSSIPSNKILKIKSFFEKLPSNNKGNPNSKINIRIIFKNATPELKISPLSLPVMGNVNILRYLCEIYPNTIPYDYTNYMVESLLDTCYSVEYASEKQRQTLYQKIFQNAGQWIYNNTFTIIDLALYNELKQTKNLPKIVPQKWFVNCEKIILGSS